ncbi:MAG: hypothetical protein E8D44_13225 [Nitrospira sp.]|nr:MAG: hypothetical protein E8D44_13225 [Nitrospira sp.]
MRHRGISVGFGVMVWGVLSLGVSGTPATAASVTFQFTGQLTFVESLLETATGISAGNSFIGTYTFDPTTLGSTFDPFVTVYSGAITNATASIGANVVLSPSLPYSSSITIVNRPAPVSGPDYSTSFSSFSVNQQSINGIRLNALNIGLVDPLATAFNNTALPTTPPSLGSFATKSASFYFLNELNGYGGAATGEIHSLTAVPIPAAVLLFGSGLTALIGLGAGSWRRKQIRVA